MPASDRLSTTAGEHICSGSTRERPPSRPCCTTRTCGRVAEARREKPLAAPAPGLGRAGPGGRAGGGGRGRRRAASRGRRRGRCLRARPPGRVGARLGRRERRPAHADRHVAGQALPGGARQARGERQRRRGPRAQRHAARSLLLRGEAHLAARARRGRRARARAAGTLRLGTVDAWLCDTLGAGFATDPSTASRTQLAVPGDPGWDAGVARGVRRAARGAAGDHRHVPASSAACAIPTGRASCRSRARVVDQQAALAGAGCVEPGLREGDLRHRRLRAGPRGRRAPDAGEAGLLPTVAWRVDGRVEYALDGGVFTAGALLEWLSRDLGLAADPRGARRARRRGRGLRTAYACCRRWPAWGRHGGGRTRTPSWPG